MTNWDYRGIFPEGAESESGASFWGCRGISSYTGNPLPAGVLDATATEIITPGSVTIAVYAINTLAYQWQESQDGTNWTNIEGETGTTISRNYPYAASSAGVYYFRCLCKGWLGTVPTDKMKITVRNHLPSAIINPPSAAVRSPGDLAFTAETEYAESMQWKRSNDGITWEQIPGATAADYTAQFVYGDGGTHRFKLTASGLGGSIDSNISRVTVTDPEPVISISADLPEIIYVGDTIKFTAAAEYTDMVEWQRFIGGAWVKIPGAAGLEYNHVCDIGQVYSLRCVAVGHGGTTISNTIALDVKYPTPTVSISADKTEMLLGESAVIAAETTWKASLKWQQSLDGQSWATIPGEVEDELTVTPDAGGTYYYRAEVVGMDGSTIYSDPVGITVYAPPTVSISADKTEITTGETATLTAEAADYNELSWMKEDGGTWEVVGREQTYSFTPETAGVFAFKCKASGRGGTAESETISITAAEPEPEPPEP